MVAVIKAGFRDPQPDENAKKCGTLPISRPSGQAESRLWVLSCDLNSCALHAGGFFQSARGLQKNLNF